MIMGPHSSLVLSLLECSVVSIILPRIPRCTTVANGKFSLECAPYYWQRLLWLSHSSKMPTGGESLLVCSHLRLSLALHRALKSERIPRPHELRVHVQEFICDLSEAKHVDENLITRAMDWSKLSSRRGFCCNISPG